MKNGLTTFLRCRAEGVNFHETTHILNNEAQNVTMTFKVNGQGDSAKLELQVCKNHGTHHGTHTA